MNEHSPPTVMFQIQSFDKQSLLDDDLPLFVTKKSNLDNKYTAQVISSKENFLNAKIIIFWRRCKAKNIFTANILLL